MNGGARGDSDSRSQKYLVGMDRFQLITDHKTLVPLINSKDLDTVPVRCQQLLMRLMCFNAKAEYAPGKRLIIADTLLRSPVNNNNDSTEIIECHINAVTHSWPISQPKLDMMRPIKQEDEQLNREWKLIRNGWPTNMCSVPEDVKDYYTVKDSLSLCEGLVTLGCSIVVPQSMTQEILERIHEGHQSLSKYRECVQETVWWPKILPGKQAHPAQRATTVHTFTRTPMAKDSHRSV